MRSQVIVDQVDRLLAFQLEADAAYPVRSRIGRLIVSCRQIVMSAQSDARRKDPIERGEAVVDEALREISNIAERLANVSARICQPSEPLDPRWRTGWKLVVNELERLKLATDRWSERVEASFQKGWGQS